MAVVTTEGIRAFVQSLLVQSLNPWTKKKFSVTINFRWEKIEAEKKTKSFQKYLHSNLNILGHNWNLVVPNSFLPNYGKFKKVSVSGLGAVAKRSIVTNDLIAHSFSWAFLLFLFEQNKVRYQLKCFLQYCLLYYYFLQYCFKSDLRY